MSSFLVVQRTERAGQHIRVGRADTDIDDGVENNAGAWITPETWQEGTQQQHSKPMNL
ncbi:hypothetical protein OH492_14485 [Vibrio chagasii]|nr:hypothetical protein [Vibrio chagasii]